MTFPTGQLDIDEDLFDPLSPEIVAVFKDVYLRIKQIEEVVNRGNERNDGSVHGGVIVESNLDKKRSVQNISIISKRSPHDVTNILAGNRDFDGKCLDEDSYTLMMMAPSAISREWFLGLVAFSVQAFLSCLVIADQSYRPYGSTTMSVPIRVTSVVQLGQFLTIIIALMTQTDVLNSINTVFRLHPFDSTSWELTIGVEYGEATIFLWAKRVLFPQCLKLMQGLLVLGASFIIIIQGDNILDLLKEFTALFVLSSIDDMFFIFANRGFFGEEFEKRTMKAIGVEFKNSLCNGERTNEAVKEKSRNIKFWLQTLTLLATLISMMSGWLYVAVGQLNGQYTKQRYPVCFLNDDFSENDIDPLLIGDEICDSEYNTIECGFDGGDCDLFNDQYPNCVTENRSLLGNGNCDLLLNTKDCGFDNGDCLERNRGLKDKTNFQCRLDVNDGVCDFSGIVNKDISDIMYCGCWNHSSRYVEGQTENDRFGSTGALSLDGTRLAVAGITPIGYYVRIFEIGKNESSWSQVVEVDRDVTKTNNPLTLALSQDNKMLVLGDKFVNDEAGAAYIFAFEEPNWTKTGQLNGSKPNDLFGSSVSVLNNITIDEVSQYVVSVGAPGLESSSLFSYKRNSASTDWTLFTNFRSPYGREFGLSHSFSSDGSKALVGAPTGAGSVCFFNMISDTNTWSYNVIKWFTGTVSKGGFGHVVSLSEGGERAAVGTHVGAYVNLYIFQDAENTYVELGGAIKNSDRAFGSAIALSNDGELLAVGSPKEYRTSQNNIVVGVTRIYSVVKYGWTEIGEIESGKDSSTFVAFSNNGKRLAIGEPKEGIGQVRIIE